MWHGELHVNSCPQVQALGPFEVLIFTSLGFYLHGNESMLRSECYIQFEWCHRLFPLDCPDKFTYDWKTRLVFYSLCHTLVLYYLKFFCTHSMWFFVLGTMLFMLMYPTKFYSHCFSKASPLCWSGCPISKCPVVVRHSMRHSWSKERHNPSCSL